MPRLHFQTGKGSRFSFQDTPTRLLAVHQDWYPVDQVVAQLAARKSDDVQCREGQGGRSKLVIDTSASPDRSERIVPCPGTVPGSLAARWQGREHQTRDPDRQDYRDRKKKPSTQSSKARQVGKHGFRCKVRIFVRHTHPVHPDGTEAERGCSCNVPTVRGLK